MSRPPLVPSRASVTINGKDFPVTALEFSTTGGFPDQLIKSDVSLRIGAEQKDDLFLNAQMVHMEDIREYHHDLITDMIEVLLRRVSYLVPSCSAWVRGLDAYLDDPYAIGGPQVEITLRYEHKSTPLGLVTTLCFLGDTRLKALIEEHLAMLKEQIKREHQYDPLSTWKQQMEELGYAGRWKLTQAQTSEEKRGIVKGDTLVSVNVEGLAVFDPFIRIGTLPSLLCLSNKEIQQRITDKVDEAKMRYRGEGISPFFRNSRS